MSEQPGAARVSAISKLRGEQNQNGGQAARWGQVLLMASLGVALISHAYNMFAYPLYLGDEGIYMEQAWSVLRELRLSPYTYFYDHAPAGWIMIAIWTLLLPMRFFTFGMAINSGRVLMLIIHVANTYLLYRTTKKLSGSDAAAFIASIVFSLSPLALFYQRMVLLDNIMVFWVLLSLYLLLLKGDRLFSVLASGVALGIAMLSKENAIFFLPVFAYVLYIQVKTKHHFRFAVVGWSFGLLALVSLYPMYAFLKTELFPAALSQVGDTAQAQASHVSLIGTLLWQMGRSQGSILDRNSLFWQFSIDRWWPKDSVILVLGTVAVVINLVLALINRRKHLDSLVAGGLGALYILYMARGSVMLEFYVVPLLPFLAMSAGVLIYKMFRWLPRQAATGTFSVVAVALAIVFVYQSHDHYTLNLNQVEQAYLQYIQANVPPTATMVVDDDLWVDLHDQHGNLPVFPNAQSHWKVSQDPAIYDKILHNDWRNIDYVIMSNKMLQVLQLNNETLVLDAYNHSQLLVAFQKGDVEVEVRKVVK